MYTFKKEERLCSTKLLEKLFHTGSSFLLYPFRITWLQGDFPKNPPVQVVINVSKRNFKKAVDRNLIKRRIREIYRLHKSEHLYSFVNEDSQKLLLGINYIGKDIATYLFMEKKLLLSLEKLKQNYLSNDVE
ncbi:MAG: ribonuclease P protein component [Daejeonella sp.]